MYTRKSRLRKAKLLRLLEHFARGTTARPAAELASVNHNTANRFYLALRQIIAEETKKATPLNWKVADEQVDEEVERRRERLPRRQAQE